MNGGGVGVTGVNSRENGKGVIGDRKYNQFFQGGWFHRGAEK